MHMPHDVNWIVVKRILRYVRGTIDHGLVFQPSNVSLTSFSDALGQFP